jgi:hypothetical protein
VEIAILFWVTMVASCGYAVLRGGREGRWMTAILTLAALATIACNAWFDTQWHQISLAGLIINLATLLAMYLLAARSWRWWPLWVAAFQFNSVLAQIALSFSPRFLPLVAQGYEGLWAVPGLLIMAMGIFRDRVWKVRYDLA